MGCAQFKTLNVKHEATSLRVICPMISIPEEVVSFLKSID